MKKIALKVIAVFEILCGISGIFMIVGAVFGLYSHESIKILWFGIFPLFSLVTGIFLWFNFRYAINLSILVLLLQIPFIYISGYSILRVGVALNLYITAVWDSKAGLNSTILGFNLLALVMLLILLCSKPSLKISKNNL